MAHAPGTRLGSYEILSPLGAGGMGEVYRARDTKLGRDVAIKILPDVFAHDADRVARFQREAQALAALNHPNIAAIHGLDEAAGSTFIVLEFVDGESLDQKLRHGSWLTADGKKSMANDSGGTAQPSAISHQPSRGLEIAEALAIARQIVDAVEAAHDKGIVHRDLKPANIMLTSEGQVKVLDFGLAKYEAGRAGQAGGAGGVELTHSPTLTFAATQAGVILGTAAYMSPEQAKGRPSDKRSDVWGFGCVLYEMLTGRRTFDGEDASDVLATVLKSEPDWTAFPATTPAHIQTIVRRCLVKDRRARIPDLSVVRFLMDEGAAAAPAAAVRAGRQPRIRVWQLAAALLGVTTLAAVATIAYLIRPETREASRFYVYPPEKTVLMTNSRVGASVAISPDGRKLAFSARDAAGKTLLYVRPLNTLTAQAVAGTDNATLPFWSPDSRFIGYFADGKVMKVEASGGPPQTLCACATGGNRGGTWNRDNVIVFNAGPGAPLMRVSSAGGQATPATRLNAQIGQTFPSFLPDGRHLLLYGVSALEQTAGVYIASLETGETTQLLQASSGAVFDERNGHLLFIRDGTLLAQPFNASTLTMSGEPFPIAERVEQVVTPGALTFSVSKTGVLAYGMSLSGTAALQVVTVDRQGKAIGKVGPPANYRGLDLSPDGTRLAAHRHDGAGGDIWMTDLSRGTTTRMTFDPTKENASPVWSSDGSRIAFGTYRNAKFTLAQKVVEGGGEEVLLEYDAQRVILPTSWSPDTTRIVYYTTGRRADLDMISLQERKPTPLLNGPFLEVNGQISPNGKWIAYTSDETGRMELYLDSFPALGNKLQISTAGGAFPRWRRDGRELFFMERQSLGALLTVDIELKGGSLVAGTPQRLFDSGYVSLGHTAPFHPYAVSADGQRFYIPRPIAAAAEEAMLAPIVVVHNWFEGAKR